MRTAHSFLPTPSASAVIGFLGSVGWTHATLTRYGDPVSGADLSGHTAPFVPKFDAVAAFDYHPDNGFFARVEWVALGKVKFEISTVPSGFRASMGSGWAWNSEARRGPFRGMGAAANRARQRRPRFRRASTLHSPPPAKTR